MLSPIALDMDDHDDQSSGDGDMVGHRPSVGSVGSLGSVGSVTGSWGLSSVSSAQWRSRLSRKARDCSWKLSYQDLQLDQELSQTLKSSVHLGKWNGTKVVIKTLLPVAGKDEDGVDTAGTCVALTDELLHEIETLSSMRHPDLVMFLGACFDADKPLACVMEYMPGGDLQRYYQAKRQKHQVKRRSKRA